jgi:ribosome biogenesis GTPase A
VDLEKAARLVLQDWSSGKIPYFTMPPKRTGSEYASAAVVKVRRGESPLMGDRATLQG